MHKDFLEAREKCLKEKALHLKIEREVIQISVHGNNEELNKVDWACWSNELNEKWEHEVSRGVVRNN